MNIEHEIREWLDRHGDSSKKGLFTEFGRGVHFGTVDAFRWVLSLYENLRTADEYKYEYEPLPTCGFGPPTLHVRKRMEPVWEDMGGLIDFGGDEAREVYWGARGV